jgi:hypothetical protein
MAVTHQRIPWTTDEGGQLYRQGPFWKDQAERTCPACGQVSVRNYMHYSDPQRPGTRVISYTWCANCWRSAFYTGEAPPVPFTDPFAELNRGKIRIEFLNEQWDKGVLPQRFG